MPTIAMASSKGGVGKTMTTVILANVLASQGLTVKVIDAEKRDHSNVDTWYSASTKPNTRISLERCAESTKIKPILEKAVEEADFVLIDMAGEATQLNSFLIAKSDLVLIPVKMGQGDKDAGEETLAQVQIVNEMTGRKIEARLFFSQIENKPDNFTPLFIKDFMAATREEEQVLETPLKIHVPFAVIMTLGGWIDDIEGVASDNQVSNALKNAGDFGNEVLSILAEGLSQEVTQ